MISRYTSRSQVGDDASDTGDECKSYEADLLGPAMVLGVPPIRKSFGWRPAERIPTTFPRKSTHLFAHMDREKVCEEES